MSSGKVHAAIGVTTTLVGVTAYSVLTKEFRPSLFVEAGVGAYVGSLIVDIDSKKSIGSQIFNKIFLTLMVVFVLLPMFSKVLINVVDVKDGLDALSSTEQFAFSLRKLVSSISTYIVRSNLGLYLFVLITILGKLSPHRQFTHKILGTVCFLVSGWLALQTNFFIGYAVGFLLHLVADATTPAGLKFFDIKLPLQKSDGSYVKILK